MGYRTRLGKIPKTAKARYENFHTLEDLEEFLETKDSYFYRPPEHTELFVVCSGVDMNHTEPFYAEGVEDPDYDFFILSKEGLRNIIQEFHNIIRNKYNKALEELNNGDTSSAYSILYNHHCEWKNDLCTPYYLDQENTDGEISSSYVYEYAIFNITHIYRTFDWENDYLIFSGW